MTEVGCESKGGFAVAKDVSDGVVSVVRGGEEARGEVAETKRLVDFYTLKNADVFRAYRTDFVALHDFFPRADASVDGKVVTSRNHA